MGWDSVCSATAVMRARSEEHHGRKPEAAKAAGYLYLTQLQCPGGGASGAPSHAADVALGSPA
jgi:hypothetical protein